MCLYELYTRAEEYHFVVKALLTILTKEFDRISMHGVRRELLHAQSQSLEIPIEEVWIPSKATNEIYEIALSKSLSKASIYKISHVAFGDLFLSDIRKYRERLLSSLGLECLFPLWGKDTRQLAQYFIRSGFRAIICTVDPNKLDPIFCGREYDETFLSEIPPKVDPCGENGEFHTFVFEGPIFDKEIPIQVGEIVKRDGFFFADIILR